MRPNRSITISLSEDMAALVRKKVASGEFSDESEVIAEGLRYLADHDADIEQWLRDEVVETIRAHDADPSRGRTVEETRRQINLHMDQRDDEARFPE